jgi:polyisoprenoid-binding protein YceI
LAASGRALTQGFQIRRVTPQKALTKEKEQTFPSTDVTTGVLDIKIDAASVNTGSGMKDDKLKSKDFFNVKDDPYITFHSDKVVQTGPTTFEIPGKFTIRGVSKDETLTFAATGKGSGEVKGTMAFDRKQYGMNSGIPSSRSPTTSRLPSTFMGSELDLHWFLSNSHPHIYRERHTLIAEWISPS